jgi:hypothetical protein
MNEQDQQQCSVTGCTREGKPRIYGTGTNTLTISLCEEDSWNLAAHQHMKARELAAEMEEEGFFEERHTKGWTYVIRMDNGNVKLGMTRKEDLSRLQGISNRQGGVPVQVLAVLPGGSSRELLTHNQWLHLRVPGRMEQFYPDPSLLQWAEEQGIHADAPIDGFQDWQEKKHRDPKRNGAQKQAERLGVQTTDLTGELRMDPRMQAEETNEEEGWDW